MTPRYLFLDIDGVVHSAEADVELEDLKLPLQRLQSAGLFTHLNLLAGLLAPHPSVRLIIHSSWRLTHSDEELRALFGPLAGRVVGGTLRDLERQLSVLESIARLSLEPAQYRVIDDQPELLERLSNVMIACDSRLGLADIVVQRQLASWLDAGKR